MHKIVNSMQSHLHFFTNYIYNNTNNHSVQNTRVNSDWKANLKQKCLTV